MKRSTDRILVTHAGSLPRPDDLIALNRDEPGSAATAARLRTAVAEVVARQASLGVDVVNDGEFGKPMTSAADYGAWSMYVYDRLSGFEPIDRLDMTPGSVVLFRRPHFCGKIHPWRHPLPPLRRR